MEQIQGLVSISIPFYNCRRFLEEAIESVLAQTWQNWELFLVDDGSTDGGTEKAREYAARFPERIRYLEHPGHANRGLPCTRNLGGSASRGEYLAFLDSDDVWLPDKLAQQVSVMEAHPEAGLCCGPSQYWHSWDKDSSEKDQVVPLAPADQLYDPPFLFLESYPFGEYGAPCPSSFLLRRHAFDLIGGFVQAFNPGTYQVYEDIAFLSKLYLKIPVYVTGVCSDRYRCRSDSMWFSVSGTIREEHGRRFLFHWLHNYLRDQSITDPAVWKALRRKAWMYRLPLPASITKLLRRAENRLFR